MKLIETLLRLRDLGNTVLVVEHDERPSAQRTVDLGPERRARGACGVPGQVRTCWRARLGYRPIHDRARAVPVPAPPREWEVAGVVGARANNLKNVDVEIPLGCFVAITGVSGSGKSSLLMEIVEKRLARDLNRAMEHPAEHDQMLGLEYLDKVINIDQSPIGRTPRSNPATYTGMFAPLRELYATLPEAKMRGYKAGRFSFNVRGGRCEACQGAGIIRIEMQFRQTCMSYAKSVAANANREARRYAATKIADALI